MRKEQLFIATPYYEAAVRIVQQQTDMHIGLVNTHLKPICYGAQSLTFASLVAEVEFELIDRKCAKARGPSEGTTWELFKASWRPNPFSESEIVSTTQIPLNALAEMVGDIVPVAKDGYTGRVIVTLEPNGAFRVATQLGETCVPVDGGRVIVSYPYHMPLEFVKAQLAADARKDALIAEHVARTREMEALRLNRADWTQRFGNPGIDWLFYGRDPKTRY